MCIYNVCMTYDDLIQHYGTEAEAARARDVPRQTVHRWKNRTIPLDQQVAYELLTEGKLKAELPEQVRWPDRRKRREATA